MKDDHCDVQMTLCIFKKYNDTVNSSEIPFTPWYSMHMHDLKIHNSNSWNYKPRCTPGHIAAALLHLSRPMKSGTE